jgi:alkylhydroperoxidase family enzyme
MTPRIPLVEALEAQGQARTFLQRAGVMLNLFKVLAHAETSIAPQMGLGAAILTRQTLPDRSRELLILLVASLADAPYEWTQHAPIAAALGVSDEQIAAIGKLDLETPFDAADRALLAFGRRVVLDAQVDDETFARVRASLSDREIVEAILAIGFYMTMCRLLNVAATPLDADPELGLKIFKASRPRSNS